jgi:hypothetical protein
MESQTSVTMRAKAPCHPRHHLWCNNGTWWAHDTIHFDCRKRRIGM